MTATILIVDDDLALAQTLERAFKRRGLHPLTSATVKGALAVVQREKPDWAVVDLRLGDGSGLDCVRELRRLFSDIQILVLTGYASISTAVEAIQIGADHYLPKPATAEEILATFTQPLADQEVPVPEQTVSLKTLEWEKISRTLSDTGYNVSETARRLGIVRRNLQRKLARLP